MAYESQLVRCPVCGDPHVTPGPDVQSWHDFSASHDFTASNHQPVKPPGAQPEGKFQSKWSHRIPFNCKSGCHFAFIIEQSGSGTIIYTADHVMTWDQKEFT